MQVDEDEEPPTREQEWRLHLAHTFSALQEELQVRTWTARMNCYTLAMTAFLIICTAAWACMSRSLVTHRNTIVSGSLSFLQIEVVGLLQSTLPRLCVGNAKVAHCNKKQLCRSDSIDSEASDVSGLHGIHACDSGGMMLPRSIAVENDESDDCAAAHVSRASAQHGALVATEHASTHELHAPAAQDVSEYQCHGSTAPGKPVQQQKKPRADKHLEKDLSTFWTLNRNLSELVMRCQKLAGLDTNACDDLEMVSLATSSSSAGSMPLSPDAATATPPSIRKVAAGANRRTGVAASSRTATTADVSTSTCSPRSSWGVGGKAGDQCARVSEVPGDSGGSGCGCMHADQECVMVDIRPMQRALNNVRRRHVAPDKLQEAVQLVWEAGTRCFRGTSVL